MKTAIYIDQELFEKGEGYSQVAEMSRSKLYCTALNEYMQNHTPDSITERLDAYYATHDSHLDDDLKAASYHLLDGEDW
jgi:hypothetical protein